MAEPDRSAHIEQLRVTVSVADAEIVADRLWGLGAGAVEEVPVDAETVELRTVLQHVDLSQLLDGCDPRAHSRRVKIDATPAETWREFAAPVVLGDLVLCPAWCAPPDDAVGPVVLIEPGVSFGLGDHPTTMMAATAVFDAVVDGGEVIDERNESNNVREASLTLVQPASSEDQDVDAGISTTTIYVGSLIALVLIVAGFTLLAPAKIRKYE